MEPTTSRHCVCRFTRTVAFEGSTSQTGYTQKTNCRLSSSSSCRCRTSRWLGATSTLNVRKRTCAGYPTGRHLCLCDSLVGWNVSPSWPVQQNGLLLGSGVESAGRRRWEAFNSDFGIVMSTQCSVVESSHGSPCQGNGRCFGLGLAFRRPERGACKRYMQKRMLRTESELFAPLGGGESFRNVADDDIWWKRCALGRLCVVIQVKRLKWRWAVALDCVGLGLVIDPSA
mmetsp:Transcript_51496/g.104803  ORF Transcript_51496/g.104803 Transcript_51496/m.104803 type:complete len:229 (+) Transcript_51496:3-689(+)